MKAEITIRDGRAPLVMSEYTAPEHDLLAAMRPFLPLVPARDRPEWAVNGERMPGFAENR